MVVYTVNGKNYSTLKKAKKANPDNEPVETNIPSGIMRREFGTGEVVDIPQTELDAMEEERVEQQVTFDAEEWKRGREASYLPIEEQLDMLYWDLKNGTTTFINHRDIVKITYPKPI